MSASSDSSPKIDERTPQLIKTKEIFFPFVVAGYFIIYTMLALLLEPPPKRTTTPDVIDNGSNVCDTIKTNGNTSASLTNRTDANLVFHTRNYTFANCSDEPELQPNATSALTVLKDSSFGNRLKFIPFMIPLSMVTVLCLNLFGLYFYLYWIETRKERLSPGKAQASLISEEGRQFGNWDTFTDAVDDKYKSWRSRDLSRFTQYEDKDTTFSLRHSRLTQTQGSSAYDNTT